MFKYQSITKLFTGMALSSALFLGCQDFLGQKSEGTAANLNNETPQEVSLKLGIKDSSACLEMKDNIKTAHVNGVDLGSVDSAFARNCVNEIRDSGNGKPIREIPPVLIPDAKTRCHWISAQIDGGRNEMLIKFRFYCPDDCNRMEKGDTLVHEKYCRDPKPDCTDLKRRLSLMDTKAEDYKRLHHLIGDVCSEKPRPDSSLVKPRHDTIPPIRPRPDSIKVKPRPDTLPPKPHTDSLPPKPPIQIPPKTSCDSLRISLANTDKTSATFEKFHAALATSCPMPKPPVNVPPMLLNCEQLRLKLSNLDSTSADYIRLKGSISEHCPVLETTK